MTPAELLLTASYTYMVYVLVAAFAHACSIETIPVCPTRALLACLIRHHSAYCQPRHAVLLVQTVSVGGMHSHADASSNRMCSYRGHCHSTTAMMCQVFLTYWLFYMLLEGFLPLVRYFGLLTLQVIHACIHCKQLLYRSCLLIYCIACCVQIMSGVHLQTPPRCISIIGACAC